VETFTGGEIRSFLLKYDIDSYVMRHTICIYIHVCDDSHVTIDSYVTSTRM
jgi:hypothetical protein